MRLRKGWNWHGKAAQSRVAFRADCRRQTGFSQARQKPLSRFTQALGKAANGDGRRQQYISVSAEEAAKTRREAGDVALWPENICNFAGAPVALADAAVSAQGVHPAVLSGATKKPERADVPERRKHIKIPLPKPMQKPPKGPCALKEATLSPGYRHQACKARMAYTRQNAPAECPSLRYTKRRIYTWNDGNICRSDWHIHR